MAGLRKPASNPALCATGIPRPRIVEQPGQRFPDAGHAPHHRIRDVVDRARHRGDRDARVDELLVLCQDTAVPKNHRGHFDQPIHPREQAGGFRVECDKDGLPERVSSHL